MQSGGEAMAEPVQHIGFAGTRLGMTSDQMGALREVLAPLRQAVLHHGDAIGADAEAHDIALTLGWKAVIHPPINETWRAHKVASEERPAKPYLVRNRDIVDETELLVAAPAKAAEHLQSGTWATVRYARRLGRPVLVVLPDGKIVRG
jgi:hypothetical protein